MRIYESKWYSSYLFNRIYSFHSIRFHLLGNLLLNSKEKKVLSVYINNESLMYVS